MAQHSRRDFLRDTALFAGGVWIAGTASGNAPSGGTADLFERFLNAPRDYTLIPFWFLNDDLEEVELRRQLDDFAAHGVYGVVPHARMGLPRELAFMSDRWLAMLKVVVEHAAKNDMRIILYDEGMYPSGSCAGQVVAANPRHATRCLERRAFNTTIEDDEVLVYRDQKYAYVNTRSGGVIRGVHYGMDDGEKEAPPSGDILNPEAVASFLHLTHDRHFEALGEYFGKTIVAIFTDEPSTLGRGCKKDVRPWTWDFPEFLQAFLGYDFLPHLDALWQEGGEEAARYRGDFERAVNARLETSFYMPYHDWCAAHGVALTGHPAGSMDIGTLKYFQIPGQDVVWRYLEPFQEKSLEGPHSTMGKCSSSAKINHGRLRNLNECFGAYGWEFTWEEMRWLSDWLLVRGVDMLSPHAFYYSVRGDRRNERPPDVGPNNTWWDRYKPYADYCRRVSWLNGVGKQVCDIAILGTATYLPWRAARVLFEHQRDFNYIDTATLLERASISPEGIKAGGAQYKVLVVDGSDTVERGVREAIAPLIGEGRVLAYLDAVEGIPLPAADESRLLKVLSLHVSPDLALSPPHRDIRYRHLFLDGCDVYFITNEGSKAVDVEISVDSSGTACWWDPYTPGVLEGQAADRLAIGPYESSILCVSQP